MLGDTVYPLVFARKPLPIRELGVGAQNPRLSKVL